MSSDGLSVFPRGWASHLCLWARQRHKQAHILGLSVILYDKTKAPQNIKKRPSKTKNIIKDI